jgi:hypothetical protein
MRVLSALRWRLNQICALKKPCPEGPSTLQGAAGKRQCRSLRPTCDAFRFQVVWSWQRVELSHFSTVAKSELFVTDSESDPTQTQQMPDAFKPPAPQASVRYACVQDPSEA